MRAHRDRTECAVNADRQWPRVTHAVPKRGDGLTGQGTPRVVGDRAGDHERRWVAFVLKNT